MKRYLLIGVLVVIASVVIAQNEPTDTVLLDDAAEFSATHRLIFIKTTNEMTQEWCTQDAAWKPDDTESRGWNYDRGKYYDLIDIDGDKTNNSMTYKFPKAGIWRVEHRYFYNGQWSDWIPSTKPNHDVVDCEVPPENQKQLCGTPSVEPYGWWAYVRLGSVTGGIIEDGP